MTPILKKSGEGKYSGGLIQAVAGGGGGERGMLCIQVIMLGTAVSLLPKTENDNFP